MKFSPYIPEVWKLEWKKLFLREKEKTMNIIDNNQGGILKIKASIILESQPIFAEVIVVRCEYMAFYNHYEYHCFSKHFQPIVYGERYPEYQFIIHEPMDDPTATWVEFLEVKNETRSN